MTPLLQASSSFYSPLRPILTHCHLLVASGSYLHVQHSLAGQGLAAERANPLASLCTVQPMGQLKALLTTSEANSSHSITIVFYRRSIFVLCTHTFNDQSLSPGLPFEPSEVAGLTDTQTPPKFLPKNYTGCTGGSTHFTGVTQYKLPGLTFFSELAFRVRVVVAAA